MSPYAADATDEQLELAQVGAMLVYELIANSRGMVDRPLQIQFLSGGPKVEEYKLPDADGPA